MRFVRKSFRIAIENPKEQDATRPSPSYYNFFYNYRHQKIIREEEKKSLSFKKELEKWCVENGWTDIFEQQGKYFGFPPNAVLPLPIPEKIFFEMIKNIDRKEQVPNLLGFLICLLFAITLYIVHKQIFAPFEYWSFNSSTFSKVYACVVGLYYGTFVGILIIIFYLMLDSWDLFTYSCYLRTCGRVKCLLVIFTGLNLSILLITKILEYLCYRIFAW